jgi:pimeloyl-ACP methyl ester carboxylesterase
MTTLLVAALVIVAGLVLFTAWTAFWIGRALPPQGQFVDFYGKRIHYVDGGQGPAIVMIHGLGGQLRNFTHSLLDRLTVNNDLPGMMERYPSLRIQVSIIFGREDRILDYQNHGTALKGKVTGSDLRILTGKGHMLPVTAPDETADWIRTVARKLTERDAYKPPSK